MKKLLLWLLYLPLLVLACYSAFEHFFEKSKEPEPISSTPDGVPMGRLVQKSKGKYRIVRVEEISYLLSSSMVGDKTVIRSKDPEKLDIDESFYLPSGDLALIEKEINQKQKSIFHRFTIGSTEDDSSTFHRFTISLTEDDSSARHQTIRIEERGDDSDYTYIYEVRDGAIIPLEYGDVTKSDAFNSLQKAFGIFVVGIFVFAIIMRLIFRVKKTDDA